MKRKKHLMAFSVLGTLFLETGYFPLIEPNLVQALEGQSQNNDASSSTDYEEGSIEDYVCFDQNTRPVLIESSEVHRGQAFGRPVRHSPSTVGEGIDVQNPDGEVQIEEGMKIEDVTVSLLDESGNPIYQDPHTGQIVPNTTSGAQEYRIQKDPNGGYLFQNIPGGSYRVELDMPAKPAPLEKEKVERSKDHFGSSVIIPKTGGLPGDLVAAHDAYSVMEGENIDDPNYEALLALKNQGVISGDGDTNLISSKDIVNRVEAVKMLLLSLEVHISKGTKSKFKDVPSDVWFTDFVTYAQSENIVKGKTLRTFDPWGKAKYGEVLKMIVEGFDFPNPNDKNKSWAENYRTAAQNANIIPDHLKEKDLSSTLTRGDMANLLYRSIMIRDHNNEARVYEEIKLLTIPSQNITLPISRTLPEHSSAWLQDLTETGGAFYEDAEKERIVVFAHSTIWGFDPNPFGSVFESLIGGTLKDGTEVSVTMNDTPQDYQIIGHRFVNDKDVESISDAPGYEHADIIIFTCDTDLTKRWVYYGVKE